MIDLHCHILPGVDDGPGDLRDSVGMARQAAADGIEAICATPHIRHDHDVRLGELADRVAALNGELARLQIASRVLTGGEVAQPLVSRLDDRELRLASLGGGGRWILLEPPAGPLDQRTDGTVAELRARGFAVLLAHPERHLAEDLAPRLAGLVMGGALVQVTAGFVTDPRTAQGVLDLARRGLVHVLSSDSHSSRGGRPVALSQAIHALGEVPLLAPHLEWIAEHAPRAIVAGEALEPPFGPVC